MRFARGRGGNALQDMCPPPGLAGGGCLTFCALQTKMATDTDLKRLRHTHNGVWVNTPPQSDAHRHRLWLYCSCAEPTAGTIQTCRSRKWTGTRSSEVTAIGLNIFADRQTHSAALNVQARREVKDGIAKTRARQTLHRRRTKSASPCQWVFNESFGQHLFRILAKDFAFIPREVGRSHLDLLTADSRKSNGARASCELSMD